MRIILIDYWPSGPQFQLPMLHAVLGLWVILMAAFTTRHIGFVLS